MKSNPAHSTASFLNLLDVYDKTKLGNLRLVFLDQGSGDHLGYLGPGGLSVLRGGLSSAPPPSVCAWAPSPGSCACAM